MNPEVHVKNFRWEQLPTLTELFSKISEEAQLGESERELALSSWQLYHELNQPDLFPESDIFIAWEGSEMLGYALLNREPALSRAVFRIETPRQVRNRGISNKLLDATIAHTKHLGLSVQQIDIPANNNSDRELVESHGFRHIRTHWHLQRTATERATTNIPTIYMMRLMNPHEVQELTNLQNEVFTGSWGFAPNTSEQIQYSIFQLDPDPHQVVIIEHEGNWIGYCWTHHERGSRDGMINMVGVHPAHQGKGLGKAVTALGVNLLLHKGCELIDITVDSLNEPGIRAYKSVGFELKWESHWYELTVN
mgnify:CR=1 FL=1